MKMNVGILFCLRKSNDLGSILGRDMGDSPAERNSYSSPNLFFKKKFNN